MRRKLNYGKVGPSMKKQIMNNIGLKILATIFSAILWLAVVNFNDPVITESFSGIKVTILNQDVLEAQDMVYDVIDNTDTVTVFITATRSTFEDLNASNIYAEADLKDVNYLDTVRIQLYTDKNEDEISAIWSNIENVQLTIEDMQRTQMVISTDISGTPSDGYVQGSVTIDQNVVRLSGPTSAVSQIAKAVVEVSVDGMSSTINTSTELKLYDVNGNLIEDSRIIQNISQVNVSIEVLETKEVPIIVETTGTPAQGYITTGEYELSRDTVTIAGRRTAIDAVQSIVIPEGAISLTGRVSDVTDTVDISSYLGSSVQLADEDFDGNVEVTIMIEEAIADILEISLPQIRFINGIEGYEASIDVEDDIIIRVTGTADSIEAINVDSLIGTIDVSAIVNEEEGVQPSYEAILEWNVSERIVVDVVTPVNLLLELEQ